MMYSVIVPVHGGEIFYSSFARSYKKSGLNEIESLELLFISNKNDLYNERLKQILEENNITFKLYEYNEKSSSYAARNYGAKLSIGEYLLFVDIDILWPETYSNDLKSLALRSDCIYAGRVDMFMPAGLNTKVDRLAGSIDKLIFLNTVKLSKLELGVTAHAIIPIKIHEQFKFRVVESGGDIDFFKRATQLYDYKYIDSLFVCHPARSHTDLLIKLRRVARGLRQKNIYHYLKNSFLLILPFWNMKYFLNLGLKEHVYLFFLHVKYRVWLLKG